MNGILLDAKAVRGFPTGHFALRLDTDNVSEITLLPGSVGGSVYADVTSVFEAGFNFARKNLGPPKYEAFAIPIGVAMSKGLFDWVAGSWGPNPEAKRGAVIGVDANFNIKSEAEFSGALVVETGIPALDAASKQAGSLTVRFQPESINIDLKPSAGKLLLMLAKQKLWRTANFRLQIDGLNCTKVSKIDAFTVTRSVTLASPSSGGGKLVSDKVDFPNLKITLSQISAQSWFDWHKSFVVDGNNGDDFERNGTITFLSTNLQTELSRIELHHLGIIRLTLEPSDSASPIARVRAELYCEEMVLSQGVNPW